MPFRKNGVPMKDDSNSITKSRLDRETGGNTIFVLIIEDEALVAEYLEEILAGTRLPLFSCTIARNLSEGLARLAGNRFDIVLLDLGLPDSAGIDTARALRARFPAVPIVVLTGLEDEETGLKALRLDVQDYLMKGQINGDLLVHSIRYAIERKRIIDALRESEERFRAFFESLSLGAALADAESGRLVQVNEGFCNISGYDRREAAGMSFDDLTHPEDRPRHRRLFEEMMLGMTSGYSLEKRLLRKDGGIIRVRTVVTVIRNPGGRPVRVAAIIEDITERSRAERQLRRGKELSDSLDRINNLINSTLEADEIIQRSMTEAVETIRADSAVLTIRQGRQWQVKYAHNFPDTVIGRTFSEEEAAALTNVLRTKEPCISEDAFEDDRLNRSFAKTHRLRSYLIVPLIIKGEVTGTMNFNCRAPGPKFSADEIDFTKKLAVSVSLALENARLYRDTKHWADKMEYVLSSITDLYFVLDDRSRFVEVNPRTEQFFGKPARQLLGKNIWEQFPKAHETEFERRFQQAVTGNQAVHFEAKSNISGHWYEAHLYPRDGRLEVYFRDITDRKQAEEALKESERRLEFATLAANEAIWDWDLASGTVTRNEIYTRNFGTPPDDKNFVTWWMEHIHPDDRARVVSKIGQLTAGKLDSLSIEYRFWRHDGSWGYIHDRARVTGYRNGKAARVVGAMLDITERRQMEDALRESEKRFRIVAEASRAMIYEIDVLTGEILVLRGLEELLGYRRDEFALSREWWTDAIHPEDRDRIIAQSEDSLQTGKDYKVEYRLRRRDGRYIHVEDTGKIMKDSSGRQARFIGGLVDISDRKKMEEEIRHMAQHDPLTDLPNRRLFIDILKLELAQARRHRSQAAILFLDLDRFKEINDALGHDVGDRLLQEVAMRFRKTIRESDSVARIGGDEFNIVLADISRSGDISDIARKIIQSLEQPIGIDTHTMSITTSIGISIYPNDNEDIDTLLRYADIAMYAAKEKGRNTFQFYDPSLNIKTVERIRVESMLRRTLERGELELYYQPQLDIATNTVSSVEALVRWNHPERGMLAPDQFIAIAEETGFINALDQWAIRTACVQAKAWQKDGADGLPVTVNLASRCLRSPDALAIIGRILRETGVNPHNLDLEITESTAMTDIERTGPILEKLAAMGIRISIDDFGTGYSSLNYLKKLPIDKIKIDRSFIRDIATDADDRAIISAVTSMARKMGIRTVAEGVETEEQLDFVREAGCDEAQGFLFSRPVTASEFEKMISR